MIEFKITDAADQQFGAILNNRRVTMRLRYNTTTDRWSLDLSIDDQPVLHGRRIVVGVDLLEPFGFGIGAVFALSGVFDDPPNRTNLVNGNVKLYHATEAEIDAAAAAAAASQVLTAPLRQRRPLVVTSPSPSPTPSPDPSETPPDPGTVNPAPAGFSRVVDDAGQYITVGSDTLIVPTP